MNAEHWKPVLGFEGRYEISSEGRLKSLTHTTIDSLGRIRVRGECIVNCQPCGPGYLGCGIGYHSQKKYHSIHRMVALAFIPNPQSKKTVNHKNGIKTDNRAVNLEWATYSENNRHTVYSLGRKIKLTAEDALEIRKRKGTLARKVAKDFGINASTIYRIWTNQRWHIT